MVSLLAGFPDKRSSYWVTYVSLLNSVVIFLEIHNLL